MKQSSPEAAGLKGHADARVKIYFTSWTPLFWLSLIMLGLNSPDLDTWGISCRRVYFRPQVDNIRLDSAHSWPLPPSSLL